MTPLTASHLKTLERRAKSDPAVVAWTWPLSWLLFSTLLIFALRPLTFPTVDGQQGASLLWIALTILIGLALSAALSVWLYKRADARKRASIAELTALIAANKGAD